MKFTFAAVLALATAAFAQERAPLPNPNFDPVTSPTQGQEVTAGETLTIKWTVPAAFQDTKVNLILIGGPEQNLQTPLVKIANGIANSAGEYAWTIPADQGGFPWYGITIEDVADTVNNYQFSPPFLILKGEGASSAASTVTITTASGTATVQLSSAVPTTTESSSAVETTSSAVSSEVETTSSAVPTTSVAAATTTLIRVPSSSAPAATSPVVPSTTNSIAPAESSPLQVDPNGAGQAKAGLFAVIGGVAVALML